MLWTLGVFARRSLARHFQQSPAHPPSGTRIAANLGMRTLSDRRVDPETASRALIELIADLAWAEREHVGAAAARRMRDEAMTLLPKIQRGDREAARRAMELVDAA